MAGSRKIAREFTLQGVYAWLVGGADVTLIAANLKEDEQFKRADEAYFRTLLYGVIKEEDLLSTRLTPCLDRTVAELSPIERSILLISTYETCRGASPSTKASNWRRNSAALTATNTSTACSTSWRRMCAPSKSSMRKEKRKG